MHETIKSALMRFSITDLQNLSEKNDLRIQDHDLVTLHHLLTQHWQDIMDDTSLSLKEDSLIPQINPVTVSKYNELITTIKRSIIFNSIF